jgi:hypothetical protein
VKVDPSITGVGVDMHLSHDDGQNPQMYVLLCQRVGSGV